MLSPKPSREPYCPSCLQRLTLTFVGRSRINCPECGIEVTEYEASRRLCRVRFYLASVTLVILIPLSLLVLITETMRAQILDPDYSYHGPLFLLLAVTFFNQVFAPICLSRSMYRHWIHLYGPYRKPPGMLLILTASVGWLVTTTLIVISAVRYALLNQALY